MTTRIFSGDDSMVRANLERPNPICRESAFGVERCHEGGAPVTVPKGQRRLDGLSGQVISLYAKGMSTHGVAT